MMGLLIEISKKKENTCCFSSLASAMIVSEEFVAEKAIATGIKKPFVV